MIFQGDPNDHIMAVLIVTFMLHFPFGIVGSGYRKYSRPWARCLYIPIVLTIIMRRVVGIDYTHIPYFIMVALSGQVLGRRIGGLDFVRNARCKKTQK